MQALGRDQPGRFWFMGITITRRKRKISMLKLRMIYVKCRKVWGWKNVFLAYYIYLITLGSNFADRDDAGLTDCNYTYYYD